MATIFLTHDEQARANYYGEEALARLRTLGQVRLNDTGDPLGTKQLIEQARGCAVIVSDRRTAAPPALFGALPDLVAFVRCAVDIRNVDIETASRHGVLVTRASPGFIDSVTELAVGFMIALARDMIRAAEHYHVGEVPAALMGRQLASATLGVIGYGSIGRRLADVGQALGMRVLVSDPYVDEVAEGVIKTSLAALLKQSDFVVVLAVATKETECLIDAEAIERMKRGAFLINVARGDLIDEAALETALLEGRIAGCAMDVGRAPDQMPSPHLAQLPNVIATPHVGGLVPQAIAHQALETTRQVAAILERHVPVGAVNADRATRFRTAAL